MKVQDAAKIAKATSSDLSPGGGVLCCAGYVQNRDQHAGAGAAQPSADPLQHMLVAVQMFL